MKGKAFVITGGGSGIGEACAMAIAHAGANVVIGDVDLVGARRVAEAARACGVGAAAVQCDVSVEAEIEALIGRALAEFGQLDGAVNCAGPVLPRQQIADADWDMWRKLTDAHLFGTVFSMKHEIQAIRKSSGRGSIVNMSSRSGLNATREMGSYTAAKWAIRGVTKTVALECAAEGIRVNVICPGLVVTPMVRRQIGDVDPALAAGAPMTRAGEPSEIADAAVWLLSDQSSYVTGIDVPVDGGIMAGPAAIRPAAGAS
ncbi:SDR family oxidoreductase (plasmid) [Sphingobium sp. JS3065]|uniref:SDR family NAD(P)-dependent oxidoreductase n=1 Tax=Sphingobium sp. JS3065 TaxID=2970925 RepID=UPI002263D8F4|nr:SDR family NAD(P)-dependent oxidoreductase [Sphingobium sp. JS3065]UZW58283.1 SDR family oxidoreductase [Sphingobium sp. JS3065]